MRTAAATPPKTLIEWLGADLDRRLAAEPSDEARYTKLCRETNLAQQAYGRFVAASFLPGDMPREFNYGPYGWITANDFVLYMGEIDARKTKLERQPKAMEAAHV